MSTESGMVDAQCRCGHPRYQHLNHFDWCKGGGWYDARGEACPCARFTSAAPAAAGGAPGPGEEETT